MMPKETFPKILVSKLACTNWELAFFWLVASLRFTFSGACSSALPKKNKKHETTQQYDRTFSESALVLLTDPKGSLSR